MIATDRDALICDMAETYGIFDLRALPVSLLATLAVGLRGNSRIKMRLSETTATTSDVMLAAAVDRLSMLVWMQSEDGRRGVNRPKSLVKIISGEKREEGADGVRAFDSPVDFEAEWARITGVGHG